MFWRKVLGSLAFAALLLSATHAHAHSPKVFVVTESSPFSEEPGPTQDEIDVTVRITNYNDYTVRVRCKIEASSSWYRDADDDGFADDFVPEIHRSVKWFGTRIGRPGPYRASRERNKTVHVVIPHPEKPESYDYYGDDHFIGWEYGPMDADVNHCHGGRA